MSVFDEEETEWHTWDEWRKLGMHVHKGQKASWVDDKAVFSNKQVALMLQPKRRRGGDADSYDWDDMTEYGGYVDLNNH